MYTSNAYRDHNFSVGVTKCLDIRAGFHNQLIQLKFNPTYFSKMIHQFSDKVSGM